VIDYYDCQQQVVAEDIIHFAGVVKKHWPRPVIVGVFYNYFFMTFGRQAAGGHLKQGMILNCPDIDYLSAPQSYWGGARKVGGSGQSRGLVESAVLHGKLWLDEMDQNSYKGGPFNSGVFTTREQDVAMIRRNLAQAFTRGAGYWMYDFGPYRSSGWWDDTLLLRDIGKVHAILDRYYQRPFTHPADVLFVYSSQVFYYIKNVNTTISSYNICDQQSLDAFQAGALIDQIYFADLRTVDLKKYRTIVFSNPFCLTDAERKYLKDTVAKDGRTIVWNYLPGYSNEERNDLRFVDDVTGMKLKLAIGSNPLLASTTGDYPLTGMDTLKDIRPLAYIDDPKAEALGADKRTGGIMVAKRSYPDHTVWYNSYLFRQPAVFRKIFQESGAHIYGDQDDVFYESSGLLMVHTKSGGEKTIYLRNGKSIRLQLAPETTRYLDAETGELLL
ncbi:MAG TPA: hypothetical protein VG890_01465, partial [Puia sp.]|nr:hypothetical protein [Puia sp.]